MKKYLVKTQDGMELSVEGNYLTTSGGLVKIYKDRILVCVVSNPQMVVEG